MKTLLLVLALALGACSTAEEPQQMTPRPEPAASDHADVYADTVDAITAELDIELDDPPDASPAFPTAEAARLEALDEAAEALNRAYLEGNDKCVDPDEPPTCFEDKHAVYDEAMDWLVQFAGGTWQPSTSY